jgi:hypothetical protein
MLKLLSKIIAFSVVFSCMIFAPTIIKGQQMSSMELDRANKAADQFIEDFRRTLDFGSAYEKFFVKNSIQILKKHGFFKIISQDKKFVKKLDNATLKRVYVTEMNYYYLVLVHDLARYKGEGRDSSNDDELLYKPHVIAFQEAESRYRRSSDDLNIKTKGELEKYLKELNNVIALYRKNLTQDDFDSVQYIQAVKYFNDFHKMSPNVSMLLSGFGFKKNTRVYSLQKDVFIFHFIEEKGQFKVLTMLIEE